MRLYKRPSTGVHTTLVLLCRSKVIFQLMVQELSVRSLWSPQKYTFSPMPRNTKIHKVPEMIDPQAFMLWKMRGWLGE